MKAGPSDPVIPSGRVIAHQTKGTPGITYVVPIRSNTDFVAAYNGKAQMHYFGVIPWEVLRYFMLKRQREILYGIVLGDGFLQKTGKRNARLRLEHSSKQKDYIFWKYHELKNFFQCEPKLITRRNPVFKRTYSYYRCQSNSSPIFGKMRRKFYEGSRKCIPENISVYLKTPLTLAVWYMDDGYYYERDKCSYIYLPAYPENELNLLVKTLRKNFDLRAKVLIKKIRYPCLYFGVDETKKLMRIISGEIIDTMRYKTPQNPVSTEDALSEGSL